jgi:hypothetical protein
MANKSAQTVIRTARGTMIDMNKLATRNELTPAVGNMKVNARGDKLGPSGQIIRHADTTNGVIVPEQNNTPVTPVTPAPVVQAPTRVAPIVPPIALKTLTEKPTVETPTV